MTDARRLKRAFAAVLKAFPPGRDPEAASHARALYEEARAGGPTVLEAEAAERPAEPVDLLGSAFEQDDPLAVLQVLIDHREALIRDAPHQWLGIAVQFGFRQVGPAIPPLLLAGVERFIGDPRLELHPQLITQLEGQVERVRSLRALQADERIAPDLREVCVAGYGADIASVAELWVGFRDRTDWDRRDLEAELSQLERWHPTVFGLLERQAYHMEQLGTGRPGDARAAALARFPRWLRWVLGRQFGPKLPLPLPHRLVISVLLAFGAQLLRAGTQLAGLDSGGFGSNLVWGLATVVLVLAVMLRHGTWRGPGRRWVTRVLRKRGVFPNEAMATLNPAFGPAVGDRVPWSPKHGAIVWLRRRDTLWRVLSDAHVQRIRSGIEAMEALEEAATDTELDESELDVSELGESELGESELGESDDDSR